MSFTASDISSVDTATLQRYPVVLLAEMSLEPAKVDLFKNYVAAGGHLIAMRPDAQLDELCGWSGATGVIDAGYIGISADTVAGAGLPVTQLQIHGPAAIHASSGQIVAQLYQTATGQAIGAAVALAPQAGGGAAACWSYDLATSVVLTRQGNPANADVDIDGNGVFRTVDLFQTKGGGEPWVDRDRLAIPQADEQMRLLEHMIEDFSANAAPLPRLWYFPDGAMTMLILTGDAHANPLSYYQKEIDSLNAHGGKITLYLSMSGDPSDPIVQSWRRQGHDVGIHPYSSKPDLSPALNISNLNQGYDIATKWFASRFTTPMSRTARNHLVAWNGWTDAAEIAAAHNIGLDANFYHWGAWLKKADGTWPHGYITGSGQPMKFVRADGRLLPIYQQLTELVDEQLISGIGFGLEGLSGRQALHVSRQMIDASLAGDYAALMTQLHVDYYGFGDPQVWAEGTLDYARQKGVPIWNAGQWLDFTETRHDARLSGLSWVPSSGQLSFTVQSTAATTHTLTLMLPVSAATGSLFNVTVDGAVGTQSIQTVKGRPYAFVTLAPGQRQVVASYAAAASTEPGNGSALDQFSSNMEAVERTIGLRLPASAGSQIAIIAVILFGIVALFTVRVRRTRAHLQHSPGSTLIARLRSVLRIRRRSAQKERLTGRHTFARLRSLAPTNRSKARGSHAQGQAPLARLRSIMPTRRAHARPRAASKPHLLAHLRSVIRIRWTLRRTHKGMIKCTTVQDFNSFDAVGPIFTNTVITEDIDGEICLKAQFEDYFRASQLNNSLWVTGMCLIGMPDIKIANESLQITSTLTGGGFVRSVSAQRYGAVEGVVTFGAGSDQHFGWATPGFSSERYAIFSTSNSEDTLFVYTNNAGSEQTAAVGRLGAAQRLRIEWIDAGNEQDVIRYYVNGTLVATHTLPQLPPLYIHLWNNTLGGRSMSVNWLRSTPYAASTGAYLSSPIFVHPGKKQIWGPVGIDATTPPGTTLTVEIRTSNDRTCWSSFTPVAHGGIPNVPEGVYLQYCATLTTTADRMITPKLNAIGIGYKEFALPPHVSPSKAPRSTLFMIKGNGFAPNMPLVVTHAGQSLGSLCANEFGELSFYLDSTNAAPGAHRISVSGSDRNAATLTFTITGGDPPDAAPAAEATPILVIR